MQNQYIVDSFAFDSASFYNNRAVSIVNKDFTFKDTSTYYKVLSCLKKSWQFGQRFYSYYNMDVLKYNYGISLFLNNKDRSYKNPIFNGEDRNNIEDVLRPLRNFYKNDSAMLDVIHMKQYLTIIYANGPQDSIYMWSRDFLLNGAVNYDSIKFSVTSDKSIIKDLKTK